MNTRGMMRRVLVAALVALAAGPAAAWDAHETTKHDKICRKERPRHPERRQEWIALCASGEVFVSDHQECAGVPNCTSVAASELTTLNGAEVHTRSFECPARARHLWNWDAAQHRNVKVDVVEIQDGGVELSLRKQDPDQGGADYQIFLGCSPEPVRGWESVTEQGLRAGVGAVRRAARELADLR